MHGPRLPHTAEAMEAHPAVDTILPVPQAAVTGAVMVATAMAAGAVAQPAAIGAVMVATAMAAGALHRAAAVVTITTPAVAAAVVIITTPAAAAAVTGRRAALRAAGTRILS